MGSGMYYIPYDTLCKWMYFNQCRFTHVLQYSLLNTTQLNLANVYEHWNLPARLRSFFTFLKAFLTCLFCWSLTGTVAMATTFLTILPFAGRFATVGFCRLTTTSDWSRNKECLTRWVKIAEIWQIVLRDERRLKRYSKFLTRWAEIA